MKFVLDDSIVDELSNSTIFNICTFDDKRLDYNDQNSNDLFFDPKDFLIKPFRQAV
jgi:hypothetical protein